MCVCACVPMYMCLCVGVGVGVCGCVHACMWMDKGVCVCHVLCLGRGGSRQPCTNLKSVVSFAPSALAHYIVGSCNTSIQICPLTVSNVLRRSENHHLKTSMGWLRLVGS